MSHTPIKITAPAPQGSTDISWSMFVLAAVVMNLAAYIFDEVFRPMRGVDYTEKLIWYAGGYGAAFLVMPGLVVLLVHFISRRRGKGMLRPKRTVIFWGVSLLVFTFIMTAVRLSSR